MIRLSSVTMLALTGCTTPADVVPEPAPPVHGAAVRRCEAGPAQGLVGQRATTELGAEALRLTGARALRWIRPGDAVTMDYREDRLNIHLDGQGRVRSLDCG